MYFPDDDPDELLRSVNTSFNSIPEVLTHPRLLDLAIFRNDPIAWVTPFPTSSIPNCRIVGFGTPRKPIGTALMESLERLRLMKIIGADVEMFPETALAPNNHSSTLTRKQSIPDNNNRGISLTDLPLMELGRESDCDSTETS